MQGVFATFKQIVLLRKKQTMSDEEFAEYWLETHAPIAKKMPGLRRYVINIVKRPPNREPDYHGIVEMWFDDKDSMKQAFASPEGVATQKDAEAFASEIRTLFIEEHNII